MACRKPTHPDGVVVWYTREERVSCLSFVVRVNPSSAHEPPFPSTYRRYAYNDEVRLDLRELAADDEDEEDEEDEDEAAGATSRFCSDVLSEGLASLGANAAFPAGLEAADDDEDEDDEDRDDDDDDLEDDEEEEECDLDDAFEEGALSFAASTARIISTRCWV